jgi:hypothetical protein
MPAESASTLVLQGFSRTRGDDRGIAKLAGRQHGVVGRGQLVRLGFTEEAIEVRIRAGRLHPVQAGVYAVGHRSIRREGRWMAAVLTSGPAAVLSHLSAAALWGIRPTSRSRIDVTTPHRTRSWGTITRHVIALPADERTAEDGIPVTTAPRTVFDLAATSLVIERLPSGRTRSPLEERFLPFLRRYGLPRPRINDWIVVGEERFQVDCHWAGTGRVVELDSWEAHGTRSEPEAVASDLRKLLDFH